MFFFLQISMHFFNFKTVFSIFLYIYSATVQANLFLQAILNLLGDLGHRHIASNKHPFPPDNCIMDITEICCEKSHVVP